MQFHYSNRIASLKASAIREILKFTADPTVISFAAGNPAPEAFPVEDVRRITAEILSEEPISALQYSLTEGYPALRDALKKRMKDVYSIGMDFDELVIVSGAQQGVELSAKALCNEGDVVICEAPSFVGALNAFRSFGAKLVGVEMEQDGINISLLEKALKENPNARMMYLIPNFQNPSGITMSFEKRKAVYELAQRYDIVILEDNPYGDLRFEGEDVPAIKTMDTDGRVIYCGSYSKILSPGLRVGYLCGHKDIIGKVIVGKQAGDVHTNILAQMICERFMTQCDLDRHIAGLKEIYKKKSSLMLHELDKHFNPKVTYTRPQGGLFIWGTLPKDCDMMAFCREAVQRKVAVVPGTAFTAQETDPTQSFRMNFSTPTDEQIIQGVEILGALTKEFC